VVTTSVLRFCAAMFAAATVIGTLVAVQAQSATALEDPDPPLWEDNGKLADETMISEDLGVPIENVRAVQILLDHNRDLQEELSTAYPDQFGGMYVDYVRARLVIPWVGDRDALEDLSLEAGIEVEDAEYSEAALIATQNAIDEDLASAGILADTWTDVISGRVIVEVVEADVPLARALARGRSAADLLASQESVEVREVQQLAQEARSIYAGLATTSCTSGFSLRRTTDGARRGTTAGHCGNTQTFASATSAFGSQWFSGSRDLQTHIFSSSHTVTAQLFDGSGLRWIRGYESRAATTIGEAVCKFGKTTGNDCASVTSKTHNPSYVPDANSTFIRVNKTGTDPFIDGGDSGGPWYYVEDAYGWTSGMANDRSYAIYMSVSYIPSPYVLILQ